MRPGAIAALVSVSGAAVVVGVGLDASFAGARTLLLIRGSGYLALGLLSVSLLIGPLRRFGLRSLELRRAFGIAAAIAAMLHFVVTSATSFVPEWALLFYEPLLRAGATALLILLALGATSFPRRLRVTRWKSLHRMVYVAALLALHHLLLSAHAPSWAVIGFPIVLFAATALRVFGWVLGRRAGAESQSS